MKDICKDEKGCSVNYFTKCCMLVIGLLALCRSLRSSIVNTNILVLSLSLCMFMLHDRLTLIMETNLFSLPIELIEELIDSQKILNDRVCSCHFKDGKKEGDPVQFAWNNSKYMDFPDPEKKDRSGDKSTFF